MSVCCINIWTVTQCLEKVQNTRLRYRISSNKPQGLLNFETIRGRRLFEVRCLLEEIRYPYNNFDKKLDISFEEKTEKQYWINNIGNLCHNIVTHNPDIAIHIDPSLRG